MRRTVRIAVAAPLATLLCGAKGYVMRPQDAVLIWSVQPSSMPAEQDIAAGGTVLESNIAAAATATAQSDVKVTIAGHDSQILRGTALRSFAFVADPPAGLSRDAAIYCASTAQSSPELATKAILGAAAFGIFSGVSRTRAGSQMCLVDNDRDERADFAIESGVRRAEDITPVTIGATPLTVQRDRAHPDGSHGRLIFKGATDGTARRIEFSFIVDGGKKVVVVERAAVRTDKLPDQIRVPGATLTITAYDPTTRSAHVRFDSVSRLAEPFWMPVPAQTIFIPVYTPR